MGQNIWRSLLLGSRVPQLLRNPKALGAASLTLADVLSKAIGFAITPYMANRMGSAEFGALNLYISVTQILIFLIALGGPALIAAEYVRNGYASARQMRAANLKLAGWISAALIIVSLVVSIWLPTVVPMTSGALTVAVSCVQALNMIELSYYRGAQTYGVAVAGQFMFTILNVLLTVVAFEFNSPTVTNRLLSIVLAGGLVQIAYALELGRKRYEPAVKTTMRLDNSMIVRFGISIFPHVASGWIRMSVDRFFVSGYLGLAATGVYSVAVSLATAEILLFAAISQQLQPFLYRRLKSRNFAGFQRVQFLFIAAVLGFTATYYGLVQLFFELLFTSEFNGAKALLPALLGASAAQSIFTNFSHAAFYERRASSISWLSASALFVHLAGLCGLALFNRLTLPNIVFVFFVSSVVAMLGMVWLSRRVIGQLRLAPEELADQQESG